MMISGIVLLLDILLLCKPGPWPEILSSRFDVDAIDLVRRCFGLSISPPFCLLSGEGMPT